MPRHSTRSGDAQLRTPPAVESLRSGQRERRDRIVAAAQRLMVDVDYDKVQVKDVADRAEVALGTLYRYFNSKDHLFAYALLAWSQSFGERLAPSTAGPTRERVKAVYRLAARAFERQPRVYAVMMQIQSSHDPLASDVFRTFAQRQSDVFGLTLESSRLSESKRLDVIAVMSAVLDENLRAWQLGLVPIGDVYQSIDRAADLILAH